MKKINIATLVSSLLISGSVFAGQDFYVGIDTSIGNDTTIEVEEAGVKLYESKGHDNDIGFNIYSGYNFDVAENFTIGVDVEYRNFGDVTLAPLLQAETEAFYINARPTFTDNSNNLYSSLILGIGQMSGELSTPEISDSETEVSYQAGLEVGYMFDSGISLAVGYRYATADFDWIKVNISGVTAGIRYRF